ncbi:MAG: hypothetical protein O2899_04615, partial [Bacteroidetes bacterium]|nr:hypothetical protein [Bacteroidota bacterium]
EPGTTTDHISAFWDVMPTIADITGVEAPGGIDGRSFLPALTGTSQPEAAPLYWEYHAFGGMQAVRMGPWKGVRLNIRRQTDAPVELYNLETELYETTDVATDHPDIVAQIRAVMDSRSPSDIEGWNFILEEGVSRGEGILPRTGG